METVEAESPSGNGEDEVRKRREQFWNDWTILELEEASLEDEIRKVYALYEKVRAYRFANEYEKLRALLDAEGWSGAKINQNVLLEKQAYPKWIQDFTSEQLQEIWERKQRVRARRENLANQAKTGRTCDICEGRGFVVLDQTRWDREGRPTPPVTRTETCKTCGGARKLSLGLSAPPEIDYRISDMDQKIAEMERTIFFSLRDKIE